jgi:hypothetical protein
MRHDSVTQFVRKQKKRKMASFNLEIPKRVFVELRSNRAHDKEAKREYGLKALEFRNDVAPRQWRLALAHLESVSHCNVSDAAKLLYYSAAYRADNVDWTSNDIKLQVSACLSLLLRHFEVHASEHSQASELLLASNLIAKRLVEMIEKEMERGWRKSVECKHVLMFAVGAMPLRRIGAYCGQFVAMSLPIARGFDADNERFGVRLLDVLTRRAGRCDQFAAHRGVVLDALTSLSSSSTESTALLRDALGSLLDVLPLLDNDDGDDRERQSGTATQVRVARLLIRDVQRPQKIARRCVYLHALHRLVGERLRLAAVRLLSPLLLAVTDLLCWTDERVASHSLALLRAIVEHCWPRMHVHKRALTVALATMRIDHEREPYMSESTLAQLDQVVDLVNQSSSR